jgi:hypothetical protein
MRKVWDGQKVHRRNAEIRRRLQGDLATLRQGDFATFSPGEVGEKVSRGSKKLKKFPSEAEGNVDLKFVRCGTQHPSIVHSIHSMNWRALELIIRFSLNQNHD